MTGDPRRRESGGRERDAGGNGSGNSDSQATRERLVDAFTKVASERGYARTTVGDVVAAADLPEHVFFVHFTDTRQCLSAAHDAFFERLVGEVGEAVDPEDEWPLRVRDAVAAAVEFFEETTSRARFFAVEALAAGPSLLERQHAALDRMVALLREGRLQSPAAAGLPELTEPILVGGAAFLVRVSLLAEERLGGGELARELVEILLSPYLGRQQAKRISG